MSKKKKNPVASSRNRKTPVKKKKIRLLIWLGAVLAVIAIAVTVPLLLLSGGRRVMSCDGIEVNEELYRYWLSYYKYRYLAGHAEGEDESEAFWLRDSGDGSGRTHGEVCREEAETFMSTVIAGASLFEAGGGTLTEAEREQLTARAEELLNAVDGTKAGYNRVAKEFGFRYSAVRRAMLYTYEAQKLMTLRFSAEGELLTDEELNAYCSEAYRHALFLEVRTETRLTDDGKTNLTDEERADARERIEAIRASLTSDGSQANFESLSAAYNEDGNAATYTDGYYFAADSGFSAFFGEEQPELLAGILAQDTGSWKQYETGESTLFIFVTAPSGSPFGNTANADFFHDLRSLAADELYVRLLAGQAEKTEISRSRADGIALFPPATDYRLYAK